MREIYLAAIVSVLLLVAGVVCFYFDKDSWGFNFHQAELEIDGLEVRERLYYKPDEQYHTLYRNFADSVFVTDAYTSQFILVKEVACSNGKPYVVDVSYLCYGFEKELERTNCLPYTERNEYGCTFGSEFGFFPDKEYWIEGKYKIMPDNLFRIKGKNYAKFIVYSAGNHKFLEDNFVVEGDVVRKTRYYPDEDVVIYVLYEGDNSGFDMQELNDFEFGNPQRIWKFLFALFPGLLFFGLWYFFGREKSHTDFPEEMSFYLKERKPWQIAAYFSPPFSVIDRNFISSVLIDFYHRKIIDVKTKGKELYIRLNAARGLDRIERKFYRILVLLREKARKENLDGNYFNLKKVSGQIFISYDLRPKFQDLHGEVKKKGRSYLSRAAQYLLFPVAILAYFGFVLVGFSLSLLPFFAFFVLYSVLLSVSSLFVKFKGDFYREYLHWQAFKKWLGGSFAMRHEKVGGVKLWDKYLIYATALGVSQKVIKELKALHLISEKDYNLHAGVHYSSNVFATASGVAGGGGVGGGGGGGR